MRSPCLLPHGAAFVADDATIVGSVELGAGTSIWYGTVVRGDVAAIRIGRDTNVQDLCVIHPQHDEDIEIGDEVTVGHGVIIHCRTVGSRSLIGMGAILLPGARVGTQCLVGAGALVPMGMEIPDRSVVLGSPARVVRAVTDAEAAGFLDSVARYRELAVRHTEPGRDRPSRM